MVEMSLLPAHEAQNATATWKHNARYLLSVEGGVGGWEPHLDSRCMTALRRSFMRYHCHYYCVFISGADEKSELLVTKAEYAVSVGFAWMRGPTCESEGFACSIDSFGTQCPFTLEVY